MGSMKSLFEKQISGVYVKSLMIGDNIAEVGILALDHFHILRVKLFVESLDLLIWQLRTKNKLKRYICIIIHLQIYKRRVSSRDIIYCVVLIIDFTISWLLECDTYIDINLFMSMFISFVTSNSLQGCQDFSFFKSGDRVIGEMFVKT